ncbi:hypothetical protein ACFWOG_17120 [Kitasatospora sp. NPDC058406]|uniref:hypothetical protein n=1 Tax=Kitasatospora sp. NPDC058406 TaxID=3346483 RepID=UPI00364A9E68
MRCRPLRLGLHPGLAQLALLPEQTDLSVRLRFEPRDLLRDLGLTERGFRIHSPLPHRDAVVQPVTEPVGERTLDDVIAAPEFAAFVFGIPDFTGIGMDGGGRIPVGRQYGRRVHRRRNDRNGREFRCPFLLPFRRGR